MSAFILKDAKVYFNSKDVSGILNQVGITYGADLQENTTLEDGTRKRIAGLLNTELNHQGFWESGEDLEFFNSIAGNEAIVSVFPQNPSVGSRGFFSKYRSSDYSPGASVGEIFGFSLNAQGNIALIKGRLLRSATETVDGESGILELGAVPSGTTLYAALHVLSVSGDNPTLDLTIVSDDDGTFDSASTTRLTFDQVTAAGAQFQSIVGPITDTHFRAEWTINDDSAGSPSFEFVVVIGTSDK